MAQGPAGTPHPLAVLSRSALRDKSAIYNYTAEQWSEEQADDYLAFLDAVIQELANDPNSAAFVPGEPGTRSYVAT